ncbi:hypothetical protein PR202_gb16927 [Eleusine coracana subsp. coracana]|uniref:GDSL esterase/lipase n=1 Tax=Eleusine coracana subsp. coracana TaxID=191504 RepID=A0AAV5F2Q2_ELECO|nr:hypothetical protein PR202_gb16927 [Eleusine coracana subsp. coracana]
MSSQLGIVSPRKCISVCPLVAPLVAKHGFSPTEAQKAKNSRRLSEAWETGSEGKENVSWGIGGSAKCASIFFFGLELLEEDERVQNSQHLGLASEIIMGLRMPGMENLMVMCLVISVRFCAPQPAMEPCDHQLFFVFGDSTLDVGNNNYLTGPDVPRANEPYYGVDFPGSVPTGRFSNGYNIADYLAKNMGFKSSPPAYLSLVRRTGLLVRSALGAGVSYASAGSGILDSTAATFPLSKQVKNFGGATKSQMVAKRGQRAVNHLLSKSVFLFSVGSNDLFVFALSADPEWRPRILQ